MVETYGRKYKNGKEIFVIEEDNTVRRMASSVRGGTPLVEIEPGSEKYPTLEEIRELEESPSIHSRTERFLKNDYPQLAEELFEDFEA